MYLFGWSHRDDAHSPGGLHAGGTQLRRRICPARDRRDGARHQPAGSAAARRAGRLCGLGGRRHLRRLRDPAEPAGQPTGAAQRRPGQAGGAHRLGGVDPAAATAARGGRPGPLTGQRRGRRGGPGPLDRAPARRRARPASPEGYVAIARLPQPGETTLHPVLRLALAWARLTPRERAVLEATMDVQPELPTDHRRNDHTPFRPRTAQVLTALEPRANPRSRRPLARLSDEQRDAWRAFCAARAEVDAEIG